MMGRLSSQSDWAEGSGCSTGIRVSDRGRDERTKAAAHQERIFSCILITNDTFNLNVSYEPRCQL